MLPRVLPTSLLAPSSRPLINLPLMSGTLKLSPLPPNVYPIAENKEEYVDVDNIAPLHFKNPAGMFELPHHTMLPVGRTLLTTLSTYTLTAFCDGGDDVLFPRLVLLSTALLESLVSFKAFP